MSKPTLFKELYSRDLYLVSNWENLSDYAKKEVLEQEWDLMDKLANTNPVWNDIYRHGVDPFKIVESHRRKKMSRWQGLGRWLPTGFDPAHNAENDFLSEIFDNVQHYRTRGVLAMDNPATLAVYAGVIGLTVGSVELLQNIAENGFAIMTSGEEIPIMSAQEVLKYSEFGAIAGGYAGYHRRTRKTNLFNPGIEKSRVWDQAQYIERKIDDCEYSGDIVQDFKRPFVVDDSHSKNEHLNALGNPILRAAGFQVGNKLFRKLGIEVVEKSETQDNLGLKLL